MRRTATVLFTFSTLVIGLQITGCSTPPNATTDHSFVKAQKTGEKVVASLQPVKQVPPLYPPLALFRSVQGVVKICFTVNRNGDVEDAHVVHAAFQPQGGDNTGYYLKRAALNAMKQWKFLPRKINGKPVSSKACQNMRFTVGPPPHRA